MTDLSDFQSPLFHPEDFLAFDDRFARTDLAYWNTLRNRRISFTFAASTALPSPIVSVKSQLQELFVEDWSVSFDDLFQTEFSESLRAIIAEHGDVAIDALTGIILYPKVNLGLAAEALETLGRMNDMTTYSRRLWLLESALYSKSLRLRDAASLGVASMDDPHAIPYLRKAIYDESNQELRIDLEQVLDQLEETKNVSGV